MRHYSLFGRYGHPAGPGRRAAAAAALAGFGAFAGLVPAQTAQASEWYRPLVFHPASEIYGSAPAGQARERQFTLVNSGLTFAGRFTFTITGSGASGFTLSRNRCAGVSLPPGGSCSGVVRFLPDQAAQYRAGLTVRGRSLFGLGKITATLPLSGTGTAAVSHLVFNPATHDYGKVPAGESATETFTLSNDGTAAADATTITMTGDTAAFPTTADTCKGQDLAPGRHCTLTIEFQPAAATGYTAQVDAAAAADHATLPLTGAGTAAQAQSVLAGGNHNCAVKTDHTLWCWGNNFSGQLGDGTTTNSPVPVQVSGHATDWATVTGGGDGTCAVKTDHTLWCWGLNFAGQLGDGTTTNSPVPVQVSGHATDWATVTAGQDYTCAEKTGGTVWCWGVNSSGQLGDGTTTDRPVPVQVSGHATDWATVTAGGDHTCAEKTGGTVWCWGDNGNGELGNGTTTNSPVPVQVSGHATDWATVTAGQDYTCAEKTGGTVWCWGVNSSGQLGDGTTTDRPVPVQVSGHATDWATVTANWAHTCAIKTDHTMWCWGDNGFGQLGDGTTTNSPVPVQVSGHTPDWATVSDGLGHTCAEKTEGTVWCWGWNIDGQLGDGTTTDSPVPVQVSGM